MKVCMVSGDYPPMRTGTADGTQRLLCALRQELQEGSVALITSKNEELMEESESSVFGMIEKWNCRDLIKIVKLIKRINPDIVHIEYPTHAYGKRPEINFLPLLLRIVLPRVKVISRIHEFSNRSILGRYRLLISIIFSNKVIIVNKQYAKGIGKLCPFAAKKLVHIPVGANIIPTAAPDETRIQRLRDRLDIGEYDPVICNFGVVRSDKGLELLLRAFCKVLEKRGDTKLLIIGRVESEYYGHNIEPIIKKYALGSNVIITGHCRQEEVSQYFALADICVLPFKDGVSTKRGSFMAALQHGLPIITTWGRSVPEGLINRENAVLIEYGSSDGLANVVVELIDNDELRMELARKALEFAREFRWENIARRTLRLYRSVDNSAQDT